MFQVSEYEAVHSVRHWKDIKHRVGPYRRVFIFTHRSMPREPIVILHSALTQSPSSSVQVCVCMYTLKYHIDITSDFIEQGSG